MNKPKGFKILADYVLDLISPVNQDEASSVLNNNKDLLDLIDKELDQKEVKDRESFKNYKNSLTV